MRNGCWRALLALAILELGVSAAARAGGCAPILFSAEGANAAAIQATVDAFRATLGANNGVGGSFPDGRREVNWDGTPDAQAAGSLFYPRSTTTPRRVASCSSATTGHGCAAR
jgi:hypothetical protein